MVYDDIMNTRQMRLYYNWHTEEKNVQIWRKFNKYGTHYTFLTSGISSVLGCNPAATLEIVSTSKSFLKENINYIELIL